MHPLSVIEKFYVLKEICLHIRAGEILPRVDAFFFEASEKALHTGVVVGTSGTVHALFHSMGLKNDHEACAGVLVPPVTVEDGSFHLGVFQSNCLMLVSPTPCRYSCLSSSR